MKHLKIIDTLCQAGYPAYTVGGAVRDALSGLPSSDYDVVTKATPEQIAELFPTTSKHVGRSFGVVLVDGIEVATFRKDRHSVIGDASKCEVTFSDTIHEDLSRRDLTINAIAICEASGEIIDDFNGRSDLKNKLIKFVGHPVRRIQEDPCRILRACRFVAKIEGKFDKETLETLQAYSHYIPKYVAPERVRAEILKAMALPTPSLFFSAMELIGALQFVLPSLSECVGHDHGKHHQEDVFEHSMIVGDSISAKFPILRLAGYLHDIGKPQAFKENGDGSFINHENIGEKLVKAELRALKFSSDEIEKVAGLTRAHMWGGLVHNVKPRTVRRFRKKLADRGVDKRDWLRLRMGDRKGNINKKAFTISDIRSRLLFVGIREVEEEEVFTVKALAYNGNDLIKDFKLKPSKLIGETLNFLLDRVVEEGVELNTRETLRTFAWVFLNSKSKNGDKI